MNSKQKFYSIILLAAAVTSASVRADDAYGKTFFTVNKQYFLVNPMKELFFRNDRMDHYGHGIHGAMQIVPFGGQSTNAPNLNKYFMPQNLSVVYVEEYKSSDTPSTVDGQFGKNAEARNFNIKTLATSSTFRSSVFFKPQQSTFGIGYSWMQGLWHDDEGISRVWAEISFPFQWVSNKMNLTEHIFNDGGGVDADTGLDGADHVANMVEAFKQPTWLYGKINDCRSMTAAGIADIEFTVGYNAICTETCDLLAYAGLVIPTGTKINQKQAAYMFAPVIGNNHHWGILFGGHCGFKVYEHGHHELCLEFDAEGQYLFQNTQWRSFDLVQQGDWSRFLEVYTSPAAAAQAAADGAPLNMDAGTSGINVFTTCAQVSPRFTMNTNNGFVYTYKNIQAEIGYNFLSRQAEKITKSCWDTSVAVKDVTGQGRTNIARNIKNNFSDTGGTGTTYSSLANYTALTLEDLNLNSAAHPTALAQKIYAGVGYQWQWCVPFFAGIGGSYEISTVNTDIERWTVFGKFGVSF